MECLCPSPTALTTVNISDCPFNLKQLQKIFFQRVGDVFDGAAGNDATLLADWQTRVSAIDNTKIVVSPLIGGDPAIAAGEPITNGGGDNSTLNGVPDVTGVNPSIFTAIWKNLTPTEEKQLKALFCEKRLAVAFANEDENLVMNEVVAGTSYKFIPVYGRVFISDRNAQGYAADDTFAVQFSLKAGWSESIAIVVPTFNPLVDLDQ